MKRLSFIIPLLLLFNSSFGQLNIDTSITKTLYVINKTEFTLLSLEIHNSGKEDLIVWIDNKSVKDLTLDQKIKSYFFKNKGDFSFSQLITENLIFGVTTDLYYTFIKKVLPNNNFSINVLFKGTIEDKELDKAYSLLKEQVVIVKNFDLTSYINTNSLEDFYYTGSGFCILSKYLK